MKIVQGTGWQGTFALAVERVAHDVLAEGPVEVTIIGAERYTGSLVAAEDGHLIFADGKRASIAEVDTFELVD